MVAYAALGATVTAGRVMRPAVDRRETLHRCYRQISRWGRSTNAGGTALVLQTVSRNRDPTPPTTTLQKPPHHLRQPRKAGAYLFLRHRTVAQQQAFGRRRLPQVVQRQGPGADACAQGGLGHCGIVDVRR